MRTSTTYLLAAALLAVGPALAAPAAAQSRGFASQAGAATVGSGTAGYAATRSIARRGYTQYRGVDGLTTGSTRPVFEPSVPFGQGYPGGPYSAPRGGGGLMGGPMGGP